MASSLTTTALLLITALLLSSYSSSARDLDASLKNAQKGGSGGGGFGSDPGAYFGPGTGIPGLGNIGGGYGIGYGGPGGGYSRGGVVRPTVVCSERGPCYKKKLTCPAKCFTSYSRSGRNYGGGGGGGGCTMDCKKKCIAYC